MKSSFNILNNINTFLNTEKLHDVVQSEAYKKDLAQGTEKFNTNKALTDVLRIIGKYEGQATVETLTSRIGHDQDVHDYVGFLRMKGFVKEDNNRFALTEEGQAIIKS